jgi:hypothetical protein
VPVAGGTSLIAVTLEVKDPCLTLSDRDAAMELVLRAADQIEADYCPGRLTP